jgi:hypothetical protein
VALTVFTSYALAAVLQPSAVLTVLACFDEEVAHFGTLNYGVLASKLDVDGPIRFKWLRSFNRA